MEEFKNIFPTPLFIIIYRPEMLKFHPYSILTGDTRVELVIYCVLSIILHRNIDDVLKIFLSSLLRFKSEIKDHILSIQIQFRPASCIESVVFS